MSGAPTGDLLRLASWWREHGPRSERQIAWIVDPADAHVAKSAVDHAVDSGATLIALLAHGDGIAARTVICVGTKVTPVHVRDQPDAMSDLAWMGEVAAIRDLRASGDGATTDPLIHGAASALTAARSRATPVIFDGLTAHAGAMLTGSFDASWLPASTSTDPAITVAQESWRVQPALDLHLRSQDDLGIRAVLALLDLVAADD